MSKSRQPHDHQITEFFKKLDSFCERYAHIDYLGVSVARIKEHYDDYRMLKPDLNVTATKCHFSDEYPRELIASVATLFEKKGYNLLYGSAITDFQIIGAIGWLGHNIEDHMTALQSLVVLGEWDGDR